MEEIGLPFPGINGLTNSLGVDELGQRLMVLGADETLRFYDIATRTQLGDGISLAYAWAQRSVDDVGRVISELRPDTVCVELDTARHQALVDPQRWRNLDIFEVITQRRVIFLVTSLALSSYQRRLGEKPSHSVRD